MNKEVDTYKIFRELEAREKRKNPYKSYDKDELIDEILKNEDEIERLNKKIEQYENIIKEVREKIENTQFAFDFEREINRLAFDLTFTKEGRELLEILDKALGSDK